MNTMPLTISCFQKFEEEILMNLNIRRDISFAFLWAVHKVAKTLKFLSNSVIPKILKKKQNKKKQNKKKKKKKQQQKNMIWQS